MKQGLNNPALITAIAASPQGQKSISSTLEKADKATTASYSIIKNLFWAGIVLGTAYAGYKVFINRFTSLSEDSQYMPSAISDTMAKSKANAIYNAMYGFGDGFQSVKQNITGLKHNDLIRVFNQFGGRKGTGDIFQRMNMFEWFLDQYNSSQIIQLRLVSALKDFL